MESSNGNKLYFEENVDCYLWIEGRFNKFHPFYFVSKLVVGNLELSCSHPFVFSKVIPISSRKVAKFISPLYFCCFGLRRQVSGEWEE